MKSRSYRHRGRADSIHRCSYECYQRSQFIIDHNAELHPVYSEFKSVIVIFFLIFLLAGLSRVVFAAYNNVDLWLQPNDVDQPVDDTGARYQVRSRVVSASVDEPSAGETSGAMKQLAKPMEFVLRHTSVSKILLQ